MSFRGEGLDHVDVHSHSSLKGEGHRAEVKAESFSPAPEMQQFPAQKIETLSRGQLSPAHRQVNSRYW
jgi:hypothetical protein